MTHKELVLRAKKWLANTQSCTVVIAELHTRTSETPDAIGWKGEAHSILVECKTSRADFLADEEKPFRRNPESGMGVMRYYMIPDGYDIIKPDDLPDSWGLLVASKERVKVVVTAKACRQVNKSAECVLLMSALRRLQISTAVFVVQEE